MKIKLKTVSKLMEEGAYFNIGGHLEVGGRLVIGEDLMLLGGTYEANDVGNGDYDIGDACEYFHKSTVEEFIEEKKPDPITATAYTQTDFNFYLTVTGAIHIALRNSDLNDLYDADKHMELITMN